MKRCVSCVLSVAIFLALCVPTFAKQDSPISEEAFLSAIENGTAIIHNEAREASSFTDEEIAADIGLQQLFEAANSHGARTTNRYSRTGTVYLTTVQLATGDVATYRSYPCAYLSVVDVGTAGSSDISSKLIITENITVNGEVETGWTNQIRYKNISCAMGCGENTLFTGILSSEGNTNGGKVSVDLLSLFAMIATAKAYTTAASILSALSTITYDSGSYTTTTDLSGENARAVGLKWKSSYYLVDDDDYLKAACSLSTEDSTKASNVSTNAASTWTFDVFYGAGSIVAEYAGVTLSPSGEYIVNVK